MTRHEWLTRSDGWGFIIATLTLTLFALVRPAHGQARYEPRLISYDPAHVKDYSTGELIDLLSRASLTKNAHPTRGLFNLFPPDRRQVEPPSGADPRLFIHFQLDAHALDYADTVEHELIARRPYKELLTVFANTTDGVQQAWMSDVLSQVRGPEPDSTLRRFTTPATDGVTYQALKYFALACDSAALSMLNRNYGRYGVPSMEWAGVVRSFGECKYTPSVPNLVASISAMMVDLGYAAHRSLLTMYPDARIDFQDPLRAQREWQKYVADHR